MSAQMLLLSLECVNLQYNSYIINMNRVVTSNLRLYGGKACNNALAPTPPPKPTHNWLSIERGALKQL